MLSLCNIGCTNVPQCYVIRTLTVLFLLSLLRSAYIFLSFFFLWDIAISILTQLWSENLGNLG